MLLLRYKYLNADKHSPASSARSTKRRVRGGCLCQWELKAPTDRSRSDCVHEQVAKRIANVRFTKAFCKMCITLCEPCRKPFLLCKRFVNQSILSLNLFRCAADKGIFPNDQSCNLTIGRLILIVLI